METKIEQLVFDEQSCLLSDIEAMLERVMSLKLAPTSCIYKVPENVRETNPRAYTPQVVSIGPLHHGNVRLRLMEELKLGYLKSYLKRTNVKLEDCIGKLKEKEGYIRSCYEVTISQNSIDFIKMILIDACFIIEHFLRSSEYVPWIGTDPILSKPCRTHDLELDLVMLENQLPFFVLEDLFTLACNKAKHSFLEVIFLHFRILYCTNARLENKELCSLPLCKHQLKKREFEMVKVQHLTDLLRIFYLPCPELRPRREFEFLKPIYSAGQLLETGVKLKVSQYKSLIELQFEKEGVLTIPQLVFDYNIETLFGNMIALEQCHYPDEAYITDYIYLLDFLINDRNDVDVLVDKGIMVNLLGDSGKVVATLKNIRMTTMMISNRSVDYVKLCKDLNDFCFSFHGRAKLSINKNIKSLIQDYFRTPWRAAASIAGIILLLLTLVQTTCSLISLH